MDATGVRGLRISPYYIMQNFDQNINPDDNSPDELKLQNLFQPLTNLYRQHLLETRIQEYKDLREHFEIRRGNFDPNHQLTEYSSFAKEFISNVRENLRDSMVVLPSHLQESNYFHCFEPKLDSTDSSAMKIYTLAHLRNQDGNSLYCSSDLDLNLRWQATRDETGPVFIEVYSDVPPLEALYNRSDELFNWSYRIMYSAPAFHDEIKLLRDAHFVKGCLEGEQQGSNILFQSVRAAAQELGINLHNEYLYLPDAISVAVEQKSRFRAAVKVSFNYLEQQVLIALNLNHDRAKSLMGGASTQKQLGFLFYNIQAKEQTS